MARFIYVLIVLLGVSTNGLVMAQDDPASLEEGTITRVGTTAAQFLKLGAGARAISLGGAYVAEASDMSAVYWNPAGFARLSGSHLQLSNTRYLADINYNFVAFGTTVEPVGSIGFSLLMVDSGDMPVRTEMEPEGTGEQFNALSFALQLTYARNLSDQFSIGGSLKFVQERIWHSKASSIAFDIGTLFTTPFESLRLGASMSNLGPKMRMDGRDILFSEDPSPNTIGTAEIVNAQYRMDGFSMPLIFRVGLAWDAMDTGTHRILITTDAAHPNDNAEYVNAGAEYSFRDLIAFRAGYRNLFEPDTEQGLTAGGSLMVRINRDLATRFDYAYADFGRLTQTHWFTFNLSF
ncbi:MAG: PorV/PorQ family protein [Bacteroidetes bacterium]|nr:PorV/PorQ family protein [Bacteroidota bacterium]